MADNVFSSSSDDALQNVTVSYKTTVDKLTKLRWGHVTPSGTHFT